MAVTLNRLTLIAGVLLATTCLNAGAKSVPPLLAQKLPSPAADALPQFLDRHGLPLSYGEGFPSRYVNDGKAPKSSVELSIDNEVNEILREEILNGLERFKAEAALGYVLDVANGEIIALASAKTRDRSVPWNPDEEFYLNWVTMGNYEDGASAKLLTLAMALDAGKVNLQTKVDVRHSFKFGRYAIHDFNAQRRILSVADSFLYSSNIASTKLANRFSVSDHVSFLKKMGQLDVLDTEFIGGANPIVPPKWSILESRTVSFGHGIGVTPLHSGMAISALVNGGHLITPTMMKRSEGAARAQGTPVVSEKTSQTIRSVIRRQVTSGPAKPADIDGYDVGGATSTAEKVLDGKYAHDHVFTKFYAVFPMKKPRYLIMVAVDDPQPASPSAENAGLMVGNIIPRIAPILGVERQFPPSQ